MKHEEQYVCGVCSKAIVDEDPHSMSNGEDCHPGCCEDCNPLICGPVPDASVPGWLEKLRSEATSIATNISGFKEIITHPDVPHDTMFMIDPATIHHQIEEMLVGLITGKFTIDQERRPVIKFTFIEPDLRQPNFD